MMTLIFFINYIMRFFKKYIHNVSGVLKAAPLSKHPKS